MTHPLTPPLELVQQWGHDANLSGVPYDDETGYWAYEQHIATRAAQWGADQELEACCEWLIGWDTCEGERLASLLHEGRRPKPPNLKEQALDDLHIAFDRGCLSEGQADTIRRALEELPDD